MLTFDHIAVGCETLADGVRWVEDQLGVSLVQGGQHAHFGTHNRLLSLGPEFYLEVIAKDPASPATGRATWFDLDNFSGPARLCNWICATPDIEQASEISGEIVNLTRGALSWQITVPIDGSLPLGGAYPTLIKWGEGVTHPASMLTDHAIRLENLTVSHPAADELKHRVSVSGIDMPWVNAPLGFSARFNTPNGQRVLR
jgi:hypothetical protein